MNQWGRRRAPTVRDIGKRRRVKQEQQMRHKRMWWCLLLLAVAGSPSSPTWFYGVPFADSFRDGHPLFRQTQGKIPKEATGVSCHARCFVPIDRLIALTGLLNEWQ
jgi:hypothetical protein